MRNKISENITHTPLFRVFEIKWFWNLYLSKLWYPKSMRCSFRPRVIITVMIQVTGTAQIFSSKLICPACVRCPLPGGGDERIKTSLKQSDYPNLLSGATPATVSLPSCGSKEEHHRINTSHSANTRRLWTGGAKYHVLQNISKLK